MNNIVNAETKADLRLILAYLKFDERKDYESRSVDERNGHIYECVKRIEAWLDGLRPVRVVTYEEFRRAQDR